MEALGQYVLHLVVAAIFCAVVKALAGKKGTAAGAVQMLCGVFLLLTLVKPLVGIRIGDFSTEFWRDQADAAVAAGTSTAEESLRQLIKDKTEAYILDKARLFGGELTVEVSLDSSDLPAPKSVEISGKISPYGKMRLQQVIRDDLGIPAEAQLWIT